MQSNLTYIEARIIRAVLRRAMGKQYTVSVYDSAEGEGEYAAPAESLKNARLIAAAPELVEALLAADKWVAMYHNLPGHDAASQCMTRVIRAALEKAGAL